MGRRGRGEGHEQLVHALRPAKTEETVSSQRQNNTVKEVGTPPVQSTLCASLIAVSTSCAEQGHKDNVREVTVEEQLMQRAVQLSTRAQLHHPALDLA